MLAPSEICVPLVAGRAVEVVGVAPWRHHRLERAEPGDEVGLLGGDRGLRRAHVAADAARHGEHHGLHRPARHRHRRGLRRQRRTVGLVGEDDRDAEVRFFARAHGGRRACRRGRLGVEAGRNVKGAAGGGVRREVAVVVDQRQIRARPVRRVDDGDRRDLTAKLGTERLEHRHLRVGGLDVDAVGADVGVVLANLLRARDAACSDEQRNDGDRSHHSSCSAPATASRMPTVKARIPSVDS